MCPQARFERNHRKAAALSARCGALVRNDTVVGAGRCISIGPYGEEKEESCMGDIQRQAEEVAGEICDHYCKHPQTAAGQEELDRICDGCPLNRLLEMIG